jgi:thiamine biosynthesis lipoprotein
MIVAAALLTAAALATRAQYLMGTVCEISAPESAKIDAAFAEGARIEAMISTWREDSELSRLNRAWKAAAVPPHSKELFELLKTVDEWRVRTDGAFDPRLGALIALWDMRGSGRVPTPEAIRAAPRTVYEEGAFGKGYALDRMLAVLGAGDAVLNFGGQLAVRGAHRVAIADPEDRAKPILELTIRDASLSTSSGSEKTFVSGGRRFSHILDPRTGQALPPRGSVSVIAADALTADVLSTALYVMGPEAGLRWAREHGVTALFIDRKTITTSARVEDLHVLDRNFKVKD